jgi:hypothetical protein
MTRLPTISGHYYTRGYCPGKDRKLLTRRSVLPLSGVQRRHAARGFAFALRPL